MQTIYSVLQKVQQQIQSEEEKNYFFIHEVRYRNTLVAIQKIAQKQSLKILDIGCFPYHVGKALELLGHEVYGIASPHEKIKSKKIATLNIETDDFPFPDSFFDLVLFNEVIEHLPQSPVVALQHIYRVTKKGGHVMVTTPNITRSINRAKVVFGRSPMYPIDVYFEENGKGNIIYHRHNREYTLEELTTVVEKTGWKIVKKSRWISYTPFRKRKIPDSLFLKTGKIANYVLMRSFATLQDTLFVLGEK